MAHFTLSPPGTPRWLRQACSWGCLAAFLSTVPGSFPAAAEEEPPARPELTIPEPRRRAPIEELPLLVSITYGESEPGVDRLPQALPELVRFLHRDTDVGVLVRTLETTLGDPRAADALILFLTGHDAALRFSALQRRWLGAYLEAGGLLFAEDVAAVPRGRTFATDAGRPGTVFDQQVKELLRHPEVLGQAGRDWRSLPDDHPLFKSFFPFAGPPPPSGTDPTHAASLEMVEVRGRAAALLSELNLHWAWASPEAPGRSLRLQFGTNLVVYALARQAAGPALRRP